VGDPGDGAGVAGVTGSKHERALESGLAMFGRDLPPYVREHRAVPGRQLRWDFAWPDHGLLLEIQGGIYSKGRSHHTGASLASDFAKNNAAVMIGWRVLYLGPKDCEARALMATVATIRAALVR
jgi:hypothetical protein